MSTYRSPVSTHAIAAQHAGDAAITAASKNAVSILIHTPENKLSWF
ncbi:MAG TPA: hypothetical protein VGF16_16640 [Bryobacteraceae bacterium]